MYEQEMKYKKTSNNIDFLQLKPKRIPKNQKYKAMVQDSRVTDNSNYRADEFGANWAVLSWRMNIKKLGLKVMPGPGYATDTGKHIFYLTNGDEIVCDLNGYWRHLRGNNYLDCNGVPNVDNAQTHFWNSEGAKSKWNA